MTHCCEGVNVLKGLCYLSLESSGDVLDVVGQILGLVADDFGDLFAVRNAESGGYVVDHILSNGGQFLQLGFLDRWGLCGLLSEVALRKNFVR